MGVQINGDTGNISATKADYSGNVTIGGTLTYEDVTNIDSVGLVTARSGIEVGARPGVGASISVDGNAIFSGITTATTLRAPTGIVTTLTTNTLTANSTAKVGSGVTLSPDGDVFATGVCTATSFSGDGSALSNVSAGKVVKFGLQNNTVTDQYVQQSSYQLVGTAASYTATSASNKLLILHNHSLLIEDSQNWYMALYRDGLSGTKLYERISYSQDSQWIPTQGINSVVVDIPDTNSHTYQFAMYRSGSTNRTIYNYHGGASSGATTQIIILEIDPT
tara:strand:+ start:56 stop:889 length:834 start_codon:yes stop_codon:yes gene_type:complete